MCDPPVAAMTTCIGMNARCSTALTSNSSAVHSPGFSDDLDAVWLVLCAQMVFGMQIGFMMLEVGSVRASHAK